MYRCAFVRVFVSILVFFNKLANNFKIIIIIIIKILEINLSFISPSLYATFLQNEFLKKPMVFNFYF